MKSRNRWLGAAFLLGWLVTLQKGIAAYKPEVTNGIGQYIASIDTQERIAFLGWLAVLVILFTFSCYFFAKPRKTPGHEKE